MNGGIVLHHMTLNRIRYGHDNDVQRQLVDNKPNEEYESYLMSRCLVAANSRTSANTASV